MIFHKMLIEKVCELAKREDVGKIAFYVSRMLAVARPELYVKADLSIIKSIIENSYDNESLKEMTESEYFSILDLNDLTIDNEFATYGVFETEFISERIGTIAAISQRFDCSITQLEKIHYLYIYKCIIGIPPEEMYILYFKNRTAILYIKGILYLPSGDVIEHLTQEPLVVYNLFQSYSAIGDLEGLIRHTQMLGIKVSQQNIFVNREDELLIKIYKATKVNDIILKYVSKSVCSTRKDLKIQDVAFYYANLLHPYFASLCIDSNCLDVYKITDHFISRCKKHMNSIKSFIWNEKRYNDTSIRYRYDIGDLVTSCLGTCADTALIISSILNTIGINNYVITFRGLHEGHAICLIPECDLLVSDMNVISIYDISNKKNIIYMLSYFHIDSIQCGSKIIFDESIIDDVGRDSIYEYLAKVYGAKYYIYLHNYKKAISYNGLLKISGTESSIKICPNYYITYVEERTLSKQAKRISVFIRKNLPNNHTNWFIKCLLRNQSSIEKRIEPMKEKEKNKRRYIDFELFDEKMCIEGIQLYQGSKLVQQVQCCFDNKDYK